MMSTLAEVRMQNTTTRDVLNEQDISTQPRKRRKRTATSGATADCFTCATRSLNCDRKRPYCAQCLDNGLDCGGYRTQLTWGVGVASRGKLRGLALPVAGTKKTNELGSSPKAKKGRASNTPEPLASPNSSATLTSSPRAIGTNSHPSNVPYQDFPHSQVSTTYSENFWSQQAPLINNDAYPVPNTSLHIPVTNPEQTWPINQSISGPTTSITFSSSSLPISATSATFPSIPYEQHSAYNDSAYSRSAGSDYSGTPLYSPYPASEAAWQTTPTYSDTHHYLSPPSVIISESAIEDDDIEEVQRTYDDDSASSALIQSEQKPFRFTFNMPLMALSGTNGVGRTTRMQYLVQYYAEVISPVIVAFDGPNNPFRVEVLKLALKSETLQHAISALSASNLRRRREMGLLSTGKTAPARRSSMAHQTLTDEAYHGMMMLSPEEQVREETFHKNVAVKQLNHQLANPVLRRDDSILATLLILCLFHMCDSGVARFQTQFAGVKKLLTLRGDEFGMGKEESKWMTKMFAWYDAFAATVNDREAQFGNFHHGPISSGGEWSYANLGGIDGRLFEAISKLGRLNMLAQGQTEATNSSPNLVSKPVPAMPPLGGNIYDTFNGNDWNRLLDDEDRFTSNSQSPHFSPQFWREWREVRQDLQTWTLGFSDLATSPNPGLMSDQSAANGTDYYYTLTPEQRLDLSHVSDSFRFSSLLYTERLANPTLPSEHLTIQHWVRKSLEHIVEVQSDTYLLWPLFITGTEVVHEHERSMIRKRCRDIQRDSGFVNNASCLELLEKVWKKGDRERQRNTSAAAYQNGSTYAQEVPLSSLPDGKISNGGSSTAKSTFRFRDVMLSEHNDGEYFVL